MTYTIKLTEDGGVSFKDGKLEMIGEPNKISPEEVKQRTEIRFLTQKGFNILHPTQGFDFLMLQGIQKVYGGIRLEPVVLIKQEIKDTLYQDSDIKQEKARIDVSRLSGSDRSRAYEAIVKYNIKGREEEDIILESSVGAF